MAGTTHHLRHPAFPVRYSFIDLELSAFYDAGTAPEDRVVVGLPTASLGLDQPGDYGRDVAPEMLSSLPHSPFGADIFQVGKVLLGEFQVSPLVAVLWA